MKSFANFSKKHFIEPHPSPSPHIPFITYVLVPPQIEFFTALPSPCDVAKKPAQIPVFPHCDRLTYIKHKTCNYKPTGQHFHCILGHCNDDSFTTKSRK